jgi:TetR/AcrR family transcriptional repressor of nem operon
MRRSREDAAATRRQIVHEAARLFRARGLDAVSVADVMSALGLTVGGFYRHFASKEQLAVEAIAEASAQTVAHHETVTRRAPKRAVGAALIEGYLSLQHRAHPESGCPVAALCSEVAHASPDVKRAFTQAVRGLLEVAAVAIPGETKRARERRLLAAAAMVGAVVLSRATDDEALARDLLGAVRKGITEAVP